MKKMLVLAASVAAATMLLPSGVSNAGQIYERHTAVQVFLPTGSGIDTTVLKVQVPAGVWVAQAKTQPVNFGAETVVRCGCSGRVG